MSAITAIIASPDVRSTVRKVILIGAAYVCAKIGMNAESTAAVMGLVASVLQAWSHYDDGKIGAKAAKEVAVAFSLPAQLQQEAKPAPTEPQSTSRIGPADTTEKPGT
jgi:hypothetical protein